MGEGRRIAIVRFKFGNGRCATISLNVSDLAWLCFLWLKPLKNGLFQKIKTNNR